MEQNNKQAKYLKNLKCKINFMKLPSVYSDLCINQVSENDTAGRSSLCRSVVNSASCQLQLLLTVPVPVPSRSRCVTWDAWFTGGRLRQLQTQKLRNH